MDYLIIITILITASIQSIVGIGVLVIGTPVLLLFNYSYFNILNILLPISILINLLQLFKDYDEINYKIYKNILLLIPFIIIFLFLISKNNINLNFIIGCLLIIIF